MTDNNNSNFGFLSGHDPLLFRLCASAERNYHDDPNTTVIKLRQFGEATDAFEDFGGYCQRTGKNCAAASFRETERKLAKARVGRYHFLPGVRIEDRIPEVLLRTSGNLTTSSEARGCRATEPPNPLAVQWKMGASTHLFRFTAGPLQAES